MRLRRRLTLVATVFAIILCAAAVPVQIGRWKFNPEKSQLPESDAAALKGDILTLEATGKNTMRATRENSTTGKKTVTTGIWDGKEHQDGAVPGVTSVSTRLDASHSR